MSRIDARFAALKAEGRAAFIAYVMAGDPDIETSFEILKGLPAAGADLIELGFPFSDPMAEGPPIQRAAQRAMKAGMKLRGVLDLARRFREIDAETPIILMGARRRRCGQVRNRRADRSGLSAGGSRRPGRRARRRRRVPDPPRHPDH